MSLDKHVARTAAALLLSCAFLWAFNRLDVAPPFHAAYPPALPAAQQAMVETGTHWASEGDFPALKSLGYQFAIVTVDQDATRWQSLFDAAESNGLQLVVGMYPPPYVLSNGVWIITQNGQAFLRYAASRSTLVKAIFVFNEPYWVDPFTNSANICGALSAAQLRDLRTAIRAVWSGAKIFQDIGQPGAWAPGGWLNNANACIADKYADATGVADLVGIWSYPFDQAGYHRAGALATMAREIDYVTNKMLALPIVDGQAFRCSTCGEATRWPSVPEMTDWNCSLRALGPHGISWYVWTQPVYDDYLSNHPEMWSATSASACAVMTTGAATVRPPSLLAALFARFWRR